MIRTLILVFATEIWTTLGQVLFKKATNHLGRPASKKGYADFLGEIIRRPETGLGLIFMSIGLVTWLAALSTADLSLVFPLGSLQYVLILLASRLFLSERLDLPRVLGTLLITAGIVVITLS